MSKKYKLIREQDGLIKEANEILWIEWDTDKSFRDYFEDIKINRSLILDPRFSSYTWLTTAVTEILEKKENYIKFKTVNSTYELFKMEL